jgi:4-amino-4-deoxy-L-arabinose transferase-like glycosyltransferase
VSFPDSRVRATSVAGLLVVLALFCAPLFIGLDGWDLANDEAIYSYAVDRILETGEWLTPRSIQVDGPFLEKPPLKFWMVAAVIRAGLVPHDEFGLRFIDAVMGAGAFIYIYLFGLRLAGPLCGVVAVLATFSLRSLLFDHGIRSNNMEAPLLLSYCVGMYHFMRWIEGTRRPRLHSLSVGLAFVLGFMTKFVAALFLPMVCGVIAMIVPLARERLVLRWRDWTWPLAAAVALIAPWFIYESVVFGRAFWDGIFGLHVYTRFTGTLDPAHLQPWHFYFSRTWDELTGTRFASVIAIVALAVTAWRGHPWQMRLLLVWWLLPLALISIGTSKLFHYAYPFLPPIALSTGWVTAKAMAAVNGPVGAMLAARLEGSGLFGMGRRVHSLRGALIGLALVAIGLAVASAVQGQVVWRVAGVKVLQNSTVVRPLLIAALLMALAGKARLSVQTLAGLVMLLTLPVLAYSGLTTLATTSDARLRTIRGCVTQVHAANRATQSGFLNTARAQSNHSDYYYLFRVGQWLEPETVDIDMVRRRLFEPGEQIPVRMTRATYPVWRQQLLSDSPVRQLPPGVIVGDSVFLFPGPYAPCAAAAAAAVSDRLVPPDQRRP